MHSRVSDSYARLQLYINSYSSNWVFPEHLFGVLRYTVFADVRIVRWVRYGVF